MKRILSLLLALTLIAGVLAACGDSNQADHEPETEIVTEVPTEAGYVSDALRESLRTQFEDSFQNHDFKGAVYVTYHGEEVYSGGAGKADKKADIDNSPEVVYHIASITKQFTAAAILQLCEQGKMSLDDALSMYYPDYEIGGNITIRNLLSMQSGIPDFLRSYDDDGNEIESFSQAAIEGVTEDNGFEENRNALREWILSQDLLFEQGERFSYCNSNYFLLGEIVEKVSGESYFDYLRTRFFEPLEMDTASFMENYDNPDALVAKGYRHIAYADALDYDGVAFGCGDMMASPKDMYKWSTALHGGRVLGDEMYRLMITPHAEGDDGYSSYGYGLMIGPDAAVTAYFHSGSIPCFLSCVMYIPQPELYIAVMSNYSSESMMSVTTDITKIFLTEIGLAPQGL